MIHDGLQTYLGEVLSEKASKCGFWIRMPSDESGPLVLLPGVQHPLIEKTLALQEALTSQETAGHIKVFPRDGDHMLILPASPLTPSVEKTVGLVVGKVIEMGTIFSFIAPPDEAAVDREVDLALSRAASALGYLILPHEIIDVKSPNFQSHVDEGVQTLRQGVLDKIGHFPTLMQMLPEYHLDFYGAGAHWLAASLKDAPWDMASLLVKASRGAPATTTQLPRSLSTIKRDFVRVMPGHLEWHGAETISTM